MADVNRWIEGWRSRAVARFIDSVLVFDGYNADSRTTSFPEFADELRDIEAKQRYLILGGAGSGKTSLLQELGARLAGEDRLIAYLDVRLLKRCPETADHKQLLAYAYPGFLDESVWQSRIEAGEVLVLIDAVDEIDAYLRRQGQSAQQWRAILRLIKGPHAFSVVATSRSLPDDFLDEEAPRDVHIAQLAPISRAAAAGYLQERGLQPETALAQVSAANLSGLTSYPLFLRLVSDHLLEAAETELPRSRAQLLASERERATRRGLLGLPRSQARDLGLTPDAGFLATMVLSLAQDGVAVSTADLAAVLHKAWPQLSMTEVRQTLEAVHVHHLVIAESDPHQVTLRPLHQSLVEFALASLWRHGQPPRWALERDDLEHVVGDWVGLQPDPSAAAIVAADTWHNLEKPHRICDILVANRALLNRETKVRLWRDLGEYLTPQAKPALRRKVGARLTGMPRLLLDEGTDSGLLRALERVNQSIAHRVGGALISGIFNHHWLHRELKEFSPRRDGDRPVGRRAVAADPAPLAADWEQSLDPTDLEISQASHEGSDAGISSDQTSGDEDGADVSSITDELYSLRRRELAKKAIASHLRKGRPAIVEQLRRTIADSAAGSSLRKWIIECIDRRYAAQWVEELASAALDPTLENRAQSLCIQKLAEVADDRSRRFLKTLVRDSGEPRRGHNLVEILAGQDTAFAQAFLESMIEDPAVPSQVRAAALATRSSLDRWGGSSPLIDATLHELLAEERAMRETSWLRDVEWEHRAASGVDGPNAPVPSAFDLPSIVTTKPQSRSSGWAAKLTARIKDWAQSPNGNPDELRRVAEQAEAPEAAAATWALGLPGDPHNKPFLLSLLREPRPLLVRAAAAIGLARLHSEEAVVLLTAAARSADLPLAYRGFFVAALAEIGRSTLTPLAEIAGDASWEEPCQILAINGLRKLGTPEAGMEVIKLAGNRNQSPAVRIAAIRALNGRFPQQGRPTLVDIVDDECAPPVVRAFALKALAEAPAPEFAPTLERALCDRTLPQSSRREAAQQLGRLALPRSVEALRAAMHDETLSSARGQAAVALGWIGSIAACQALVDASRLPLDGFTKTSLAEALGRIGGKAALGVLSAMLTDPAEREGVRVAAARGLAWLTDAGSVPALLEVAGDSARSPSTVRQAALFGLGRIKDTSVTAPLCGLVADVDEPVSIRIAAARVLSSLRFREAAPTLRVLIANPTCPVPVRSEAIRALRSCGDTEDLSSMRQIAEDCTLPAALRLPALKLSAYIAGYLGDWAISIAASASPSNTVGVKSSQFRGAVLKLGGAVGRSAEWDDYLERVATSDDNWGNRTIAVGALILRRTVTTALVQSLLHEASTSRRSGRTINATSIPKACVLWCIGHAAERGGEASNQVQLGIEFLLKKARPAFVYAVFESLADLPLGPAERCFEAIAANPSLAGLSETAAFRLALDQYKRRLEHRTAIRGAEEAFLAVPEEIVRNAYSKERSSMVGELPVPDVVLVTTTIRERRAVMTELSRDDALPPGRITLGGTVADLFTRSGSDGRSWRIAIVQPEDKGPLPMQRLVNEVCWEAKPRAVFLIGCCGGFQERGVKLGDVIVARRVYGYQRRTHHAGEITLTPDPYRTDSDIIKRITRLLSDARFDVASRPSVHVKDFASAEDLIDDPQAAIRAKILNVSDDIYGFEMEGHGFAYALHEALRGSSTTGVLIKGVSDLGQDMDTDKEKLQADATVNSLHLVLDLLKYEMS